ncbi:MAG: inositol monophosphatase family protein [Alphaproteobacteria bacterium]|nr:inositol monophosphatase family protein [Alphaproteobacteria bacterium]
MGNINQHSLYETFLSVAEEAAAEAAKVSLGYFSGEFNVDYKGDESPVTVADRETEQVLRNILMSKFPDHGIFGEEHGIHNLDAEFIWVLDPIDGTKSFITGIPLFGMLISLVHNGLPVASLVVMPALGEVFRGIKDMPTRDQKAKLLKTRPCNDLTDALCFVGEADKMFADSPGLFEALQKNARLARFGYDCYPYVKLADGRIDVVIERNLQPYDYCALVPVVEGAGGVITDWDGNALTLESNGEVVAAGDPKIHKQMLNLISEWRKKSS